MLNKKEYLKLNFIDYRIYKALIVGALIGIVVNIAYFILFFYLDIKILALVNFIGIFVYLFSYFLAVKGFAKLPYVLIIFQIVVSCTLSSIYLGESTGFYYFVIIFFPITFLYSKWKNSEMLTVTLFIFIGYLLTAFSYTYSSIKVVVDSFYLEGLFIGNLIGSVVTVLAVFFNYNKSIRKVEEELLEANSTLKNNNEEKNILLKEIHHRVKNNLHVVNSILEVQALEVKDLQLKSYLQDAQRRIISMATIHEKMYGSDNLKSISASDYIESLIFDLQNIYDSENKIKIELEFQNVEFDLDTIAPLAFLVNEVVTNSYKHAFKKVEFPKIFGSLKIIDEKQFGYNTDLRRSAQQEIPLFTQTVKAYDVVYVADESKDFAEFIPFNTSLSP